MISRTVVVATVDMTVKLGITLPKSTIQEIDHQRGDIPRSRYIRRAIERYLGSNSSKDIDIDSIDNKATALQKKEEEIGK